MKCSLMKLIKCKQTSLPFWDNVMHPMKIFEIVSLIMLINSVKWNQQNNNTPN